MRYLPLSYEIMNWYRQDDSRWIHDPEIAPVVQGVLGRVRDEGPLSSRHFEAPPDAPRMGQWESWYGTKPERKVLASLWASGDLLISMRDRTFARWYDLPERVAPSHWNTDPIHTEELATEILRHAMRALGIATVPWLTDYWRTGGRAYVSNAEVRRTMPRLVESGDVIPVILADMEGEFWLDASMLPILDGLHNRKGWPTKTTFLSPFDNLIWNRDRMERLWGMHYRLEIYTPAPKRVYGYYSMPILYRGQLVGRFDPSLNRRSGLLTIRVVHLEPWVKPSAPLTRAIANTLDQFLAFLGGKDWYIEQSNPAGFATALNRLHG